MSSGVNETSPEKMITTFVEESAPETMKTKVKYIGILQFFYFNLRTLKRI